MGALPLAEFVAFTAFNEKRPLYSRDVLNALCFPPGWLLTLSYRKPWVDAGTWKLAEVSQLSTMQWTQKSLDRACRAARSLASLRQRQNWSKGKVGEILQEARAILMPTTAAPLKEVCARRMLGQRLLIVLAMARSDGSFEKYVALRFSTIVACELHPPVELDDASHFVTITVRLEARPSRELVTDWQAVFADSVECPKDRTGSKFLCAVKKSPGEMLKIEGSTSRPLSWHDQIAALVKAEPSLATRCRFVTLSSIRRASKRFGRPTRDRRRAPTGKVTTIVLDAGRSYEIDAFVHEASMQPKNIRPISVQIVGAHLEVSAPAISQFGSGAVIHYLLATQRKFSPEIVGVNFFVDSATAPSAESTMQPAEVPNIPPQLVDFLFSVEQKPESKGQAKLVSVTMNAGDNRTSTPAALPAPNQLDVPEFQLRLEISPPALFWFWTVLLITLGTVLLNLSADSIPYVARVVDPIYPDVVDWFRVSDPQKPPASIGWTVLGAKTIGGLLLAAASYYALRRLPTASR